MHSKNTAHPENINSGLASLRKGFLQVGVFSLFINLLMLMPPLYMLQVYDRVLTSRSSETLLLLTLLLGWMFLTLGVLEFVRSRMMVRLGAQLDERMSKRLYRVAMRLALRHPGRYGAQPLNDLSNLRQFISGNGTFAFFDAPWVPVYLGILFLFHPHFGLLALFAALLLGAMAIVNEYSTRAQQRSALEGQNTAARIAEAQMRNPEVLRAMGMEAALRERWLASYREAMRAANDAADRTSVWATLSKTLRLTFQSLMLGLGAYLAIHNQITAGMVIAGSIILGRSLAPIDQLIGAWKGFIGARLAYKRLNDLLDDMPEEPRRLALPVPRGELTVEKAVLIPPGSDSPALRGIHFGLHPGEALAVIGPSAAGKSSLARAILGLWPLSSGHIRLDGAGIEQWNPDQLGPRIGYLPQDVELFEGTVAENIARFGKLDEHRIAQAARIAGVDRMIRALPQGYDTLIGEDGIALSGGQRQRIGLARAVYGRPRLIVLDEPNANLDRAGDFALATACAHLKAKGVTLVLISHRREILQHVDKILVIERGMQTLFGPRDAVLEHLDNQARPPAPRQPLPIPERKLRMAV